MGYDKEIRQERSIPVQSRVNLVELAELDRYFMEHGQEIRTMSQLLSWGISLLIEVLEANNALTEKFESLTEAHRYLNIRGLYQPGMMNRGRKKLGMSMGYESLRLEGVDPRWYDKNNFENIHNENSVKTFEGKVVSGREDETLHHPDMWEEVQKRITEEKEKDRLEELRKYKESLVGQGKMVMEKVGSSAPTRHGRVRHDMSEEEVNEYIKASDKEIIARENAPVDLSQVKTVD